MKIGKNIVFNTHIANTFEVYIHSFVEHSVISEIRQTIYDLVAESIRGLKDIIKNEYASR